MQSIIVLNDGETFTALSGCKIIAVPDDWDAERIDAMLKDDSDNEADQYHFLVVAEFA